MNQYSNSDLRIAKSTIWTRLASGKNQFLSFCSFFTRTTTYSFTLPNDLLTTMTTFFSSKQEVATGGEIKNLRLIKIRFCTVRRPKPPPVPQQEISPLPFFPEPENLKLEPEFDLENLRTFPLEDVCFDSGSKGYFTVVYCPCKKTACVRKCCPDQQFYDDTTESCVENKVLPRWRPLLENVSPMEKEKKSEIE